MQLNLTFNKPAASQLLNGAQNIKVKIDGEGKVMFKATNREAGRGIYSLSPRTRGGVGITLTGTFAEQFLQNTKMGPGTHMAVEPTSYKWLVADAVEGKPSKLVPTARLWRTTEERVAKDAPAKRTRKARQPSMQAA